MSKKELRKELELTLVKTIEEVLNKRNPSVTEKIRKATHEASKTVAKKFYKNIKTVGGAKSATTAVKVSKPVNKAAVKSVPRKKAVKRKK